MTPSIAIIGTGPAGCYTAQALRKSLPDAEITMIDRLPVPYGLVRYGVAADHQGTKVVTRQFSRVFERQDVAYLGNVDVGSDISLDDIRDEMDVVVLATGLYADRPLGVAGADMPDIYGSGQITRYWNGHPDSHGFAPNFGKRVAIIGNGNVAMDIVRLLSKTPADFAGSDMDLALLDHRVEDIHVVGRSDLGAAKFDIAIVKELAGIDDLCCLIAEEDNVQDTPISKAVKEVVDASDPYGSRRVTFHSGWMTHYITAGEGGVKALHLARKSGEVKKQIACDSIVTAIGFGSEGSLDRASLLQGTDAQETGVLGDGLFATGWFRRGPTGTIPANRTDAIEVAAAITDWFARHGATNRPGRAAVLEHLGHKVTSYDDWRVIDKYETETAPEGRCRKKVRSRNAMLDIIEAAKG